MELGLAGRVVLVTGSSKGIGFAIARAFARAGCKVVLNARNAPGVESAAAEIHKAAPSATWQQKNLDFAQQTTAMLIAWML